MVWIQFSVLMPCTVVKMYIKVAVYTIAFNIVIVCARAVISAPPRCPDTTRALSFPACGIAVMLAAIFLPLYLIITGLLTQLKPPHISFIILVSFTVRVSQSAWFEPPVRFTKKDLPV